MLPTMQRTPVASKIRLEMTSQTVPDLSVDKSANQHVGSRGLLFAALQVAPLRKSHGRRQEVGKAFFDIGHCLKDAYNCLSRAFFWSIRLLKRIRWNQLSLP